VPQGRHAHGLLARGREILEALFPGLTDELIDLGALPADITGQARWYNVCGYQLRFQSGLLGLLVSRPLLEARVRARVLALLNVQASEHCDVLGLATSEDQGAITGVRVLPRAPGSAEEVVEADLVVDASGRGSRTPAWLEALGYPRPEEEQVRVGLTYTTRLYQRKPEQLDGDRALIMAPAAPAWRMAAMLAQEGDRWIVSLGGYLGDHAPSDEQGFLQFAKSLPAPDIYEVIREAAPLSELVSYKFPASQRRSYEKLARFPQGYLVFGDAISSFNPIYGQGMTVAALEAVALQECLAGGAERLAQRFFQRASRLVDIPWSIAVGSDLRLPAVEGPRSPMVRFINWYVGKVHVAARRDPVVALAFQQVANLMTPPPSLLQPRVAVRVLRGTLRPARTVEVERAPALS
jgi:2-polyprenyl-6-methoxyphenol hydroxylase-like FAD-dependent oxidoreductase